MKKILIANRGEIAVRVIRSAQSLGLNTIAIYSAEDQHAPHTTMADKAFCIPGSTPVDAYLNSQAIIQYCVQENVDAVHPGYGFLSENPAFAHALAKAGIKLIGPSEKAIALMGNKRSAKELATQHAVPCIPGENLGSNENTQQAKTLANGMGYPVLIKAAAGGGGRGMRVCRHESEFDYAYLSARNEATNAFGSSELILEKWIENGFHVEIQVLFDQHGHGIHLGERDCSLQRRHQKIIEESPSLQLDDTMRRDMGEAAIRLGKACGYEGAGTVEFLVHGKHYYFLEMNTRLQVEHPVTELCTGIDLVAWQLRIAQGEALTLKQTDIRPVGHAIEARVCAEDPNTDFSPQIGTILTLKVPATTSNVRIDHGISEQLTLSPHYDSLLGKWIAWGHTRNEAIQTLHRALSDTTLFGVTTNINYLKQCLIEPDFLSGNAHIHWIDQHPPASRSIDQFQLMISAIVWFLASSNPAPAHAITPLVITKPWSIELFDGSVYRQITLKPNFFTQQFEVECEQSTLIATIVQTSLDEVTLSIDGIQETLQWTRSESTLWIKFRNTTWNCETNLHKPPTTEEETSSGVHRAHLPGRILSIDVNVGDSVTINQPLLRIESMKMEHTCLSQVEGIVKHIAVKTNAQVNTRDLLVQVDT